jgi:DNA-binding transcriptional ArsR family regulator
VRGRRRRSGSASTSQHRYEPRLGEPQPKVSNHLACLRWCGFVEARREHRTVLNRIADPRVNEMLDLAHALLADNAEHVAACCQIDSAT